MRIKLTIPVWPPSTNSLWRSFNGRNILSKNARLYYEEAGIHVGRPKSPRVGDQGALIELYPPSRRKFDLDNHVKAVLDVMTKANYWVDDSQVVELMIRKHPFLETRKGEVEITIWSINDNKPQ